MVDAIRQLADELGHTPTVSEMQEYGEMSPTPAYRHWGNWKDALAAADITDTTASESAPSTTSERDTPVKTNGGDSDLDPNELAELYDLFRRFGAIVEEAAEALDGEAGAVTEAWHEFIADYWGGNGKPGAKSLGDQQRERNDLSIATYVKVYGDGTRIRSFHHVDPAPLSDAMAAKLDALGVTFDQSTALVPVTKDPIEPLPIIVESREELDHARSLLDKFPARPTAGHDETDDQPSHDDADDQHADDQRQTARVDGEQSDDEHNDDKHDDEASEDLIPPQGRLQGYQIEVLEVDDSPGSRRDASLTVRTEDDTVVKFQLWTKHDIDVDWETDTRYVLDDVRHKVWNSTSGVGRSLSSTKDLVVRPLDEQHSTLEPSTETLGEDHVESADILEEIKNDFDL